jgi:uncharacterized membrane protein YdjX (TVP38/TMEM64 family)
MPADSPVMRPAHTFRFWAVVGCIGLGAAFLVLTPSVGEGIDRAIAWAEQQMERHRLAGAAVFFVFSALSAMLAFASSAILVPPATLVWGQPVTFLLLWGGWLVGAIAAYGIGRLAFPLLRHSGYQEKLEKYQDYVSRRMSFWMVLLFCIAIPSEIPSYLFGSLRYPFWKFLAAMATAEMGYALGIVIAGEGLLIDKPFFVLAVIAVAVAVALLAGWVLRANKKH